MKVGDIVKFEPLDKEDTRNVGTVIRFDTYVGAMGMDSIIEVFWSTGQLGWILENRVKVISEIRTSIEKTY
jgi:hypothetical protein